MVAVLTGSNHFQRAMRTAWNDGVPNLCRKALRYLRDEREIDIAVRMDAKRLREKAARHPSARGIFIDCGSNLGQGYSYFVRRYPLAQFDFVLVEPNPHCLPALRSIVRGHEKQVRLIEAAACTYEGSTLLFGTSGGGNETSDAATIVPYLAPDPDHIERVSGIEVRTFSLSDLLMGKRDDYGAVAVKLDIEGAEYAVLEDLIERGLAPSIDALYVEFHSRYICEPARSRYARRERAIQEKLAGQGVNFRLWK